MFFSSSTTPLLGEDNYVFSDLPILIAQKNNENLLSQFNHSTTLYSLNPASKSAKLFGWYFSKPS